MLIASILILFAVLTVTLVGFFGYRKFKKRVQAQPPSLAQAVDWQDFGDYSFWVYSYFYTWVGHPDLDSEDFHDAAFGVFHKKTGQDRKLYNQLFTKAWAEFQNKNHDTTQSMIELGSALPAFIVESYALLNPNIRMIHEKDHKILTGFFAQVQTVASQRVGEKLKNVQPATAH